MQISVNGQPKSYEVPPTGEQLLMDMDIPASIAVAEVNGAVVPKAQFLEQVMSDGDVVELVTLVGGG
jgi:sulfur carrier protein